MDPALRAKFIIGVVGNIATISTSLATLPTFWKIWKRRSTEDFSMLPYFMSFTNNLLWGWYALPFITRNNFELLTICIAQVALQSIYLLLFFIFTNRYQRIKLLRLLLLVGLIFTVEVVLCLRILGTSKRQVFAGTAATITSILCFASPLSIMGLVIKTKSVEYMPLLLSLALLFNCVTWTAYAFLGNDLFLAIAEILGDALALAQLILYACYYRAKTPPVHVVESLAETNKSEAQVELGIIIECAPKV